MCSLRWDNKAGCILGLGCAAQALSPSFFFQNQPPKPSVLDLRHHPSPVHVLNSQALANWRPRRPKFFTFWPYPAVCLCVQARPKTGSLSDFILDQAQRLLGTRHPFFLGIFPDSVPSSERFFPCLARGNRIKGSPVSPAESP